MSDTVLVADIGGTNARFALASIGQNNLAVSDIQRFPAEDFETIYDAAHAYFEIVGTKPQRACIAVAGPVDKNDITFTNSPWQFQQDEIAATLGIESVQVVNDFYALAAAIETLTTNNLTDVRAGTSNEAAPKLVIGPGTGLGQALIVPTCDGPHIIPTEGGHIAFAPRSDDEIYVTQFIRREHPRVSVERLLSGRGLVNIHRALCIREGSTRVNLRSAEIAAAAAAETYPIAKMAVEMFCSILGRTVGDMVLATGAQGGVYLGGGILPKIKDMFLRSAFCERFLDKGRMTSYVEPVPIKLITHDNPALSGAAAIMQRQQR